VVAQRGNLGRAITIMRTTVDEDPAYAWGWRFLADWYDTRGRAKKHLEAAEQLVALASDDPVSFVHRAEAHRHLDHLEAARQDYQRALEMAPDYVYAALQLFDLDLDAGEHRSARAALRTIKQYGDAVDYHERALRLSIAGGQRDRACKHLERLCKASDGAEDTVGQAVELFD